VVREFYAVLEQVLDLLPRRSRVSYRALQAQFSLDDDFLEALKDEADTHRCDRGRRGQSKEPERRGGSLRRPTGGKKWRRRSQAETVPRLQRRGGAYRFVCLFAFLIRTAS